MRLVRGSVLLLCLVPLLHAGIFGVVRGIVHDAQHRPVSGVQIALRARLSDWQKTAVTGDDGEFEIDAVPAGDYTIRFTREGFRDLEQALTVTSDSAPLLHFPMQLAAIEQRIEVFDTPDQTYPDSSSAPVTLTRADTDSTPGARRANSLDLITNFVPGATIVHDQLHVRGGHQVSWLVDGVPVPNSNIATNVGPQFDPKDIDTFEVSRGGYSAEYGDRTYGVFNLIPRTGFERNREIEIDMSYGSLRATDSQISLGDHTARFAWYLSLSGNRTDAGLEPPETAILHDQNNGESAFVSLIFNATPSDQLRLVTSARADFFQIPNTTQQQSGEIRDAQRERDAFVNFSWIHTAGPGLLFTLAPFFHWNHAAYDSGPNDQSMTTDHHDSKYAGGLASLAITRGRHNARFGLYGFAQSDDARFALVTNDGPGSFPLQSERPSGQLFAAFAEDQLRLTDWLTINGGVRYTHFSGLLVENNASPRLGAALHIPRLKWVLRAFYGRYYQAPPLSTVSDTLLNGQGFLSLHGERDEQREFGLTIPFRGWTFDVSNFLTHARNFLDHDFLGNANISLPATLDRARIRGWEFTGRSPEIRRRARVYLTYSHQFAQASGGITGGLTDFSPPPTGFYFLDHDQRDTLAAGVHLRLPWRAWTSGNLSYGSGFLNGDGFSLPSHLGRHTTFDLALGKSFGESISVTLTAQNIANSRYFLDNSNSFGGTHFNLPRQVSAELRYRFHF